MTFFLLGGPSYHTFPYLKLFLMCCMSDARQAFDKVPHQRLLLKLKAHGIGDSITDWIEQWLTDRRQRVVVDGEVSNWKSVFYHTFPYLKLFLMCCMSDARQAFDKVPHQRLLLKLKAHGIGDSITDWIEQWLTDRRQRVVVDGEVSNWKSVLSGVPQGSVLGPILFLIYINDLDESITSNVLKFADDTKLFRKVNTDGDKQHLQNDLDRLVKWSEKWQMLFNFGKCKCLHTGHGNLNVNYKMGATVLGTTVKEKDLGVTISADMKVSEQCGIAASKGNQILGLIRRNITYKGKKLIIPLYKAIVRPHLEYCIQAWRPYRKKDIDTLERIQRRATKMIPELRDLSYEERLKECGLTTLETRRLRGDQIEVFKILNGYENIDRNMFFSLKKDSRTRGHEVKLVKDQCRLDIRKHSFSQRTINEWNKLSTDCVTASSVNMFKNKVDTYIRRAGYK